MPEPRAGQPALHGNDRSVRHQSAMRVRAMASLIPRCLSKVAALVGRRSMAAPVEAADPMPPSIATRLLILVSIAMLPLLFLSAFLVLHDADGNRAKLLQQFQATTRVMSLAVDAEIERQLAVAYTLRNALVSEGTDLLDFYNLAKAIAADVPDVRVALYDKTGRMLTTTILPFGSELPATNVPEGVQRVIDTQLPYVSDLIKDTVSSYVTQVFVPVIKDGTVTFILSIGYPPSRISRILRQRSVAQDGIGVVFDRAGIIIARTRSEAQFLGHSVVPDLIAAAGASDEGFFETNTLEGIPIRGTFMKSSGSGWATALAIPWGEVNAPLVRSLTLLGGGAAVLILGVMVITIHYGRTIARPLIQLSEMAIALGRGEPLPYPHLNIKEAQEIADRLRGSADELYQRNATLREQAIALDVANKELEGFSYSTSHVLRAPLRAISGFSQILLESHSSGLDSEGKRLVGIIRVSSLDINQQIDGILEFLRLGRDTMSRDVIDMDGAVQTAVKALEPKTRVRKMKIEIAPLPDALGDASMIGRVWANLLGNAVKFTSRNDNPTISVGAVSDERETTYYVRDNGVGFDMQFVGRLFAVFSRLHGAEFAGKGMGLAIVERVVFRHGGRVWAEGKVGEGATFYFALPLLMPAHV